MSTIDKARTETEVEYRTIERYPGYKFGSDGSIWTSLHRSGSMAYVPGGPWRQLRTKPPRSGRYVNMVIRNADGKQVQVPGHRLIAEAFLGPCPDGMEVRHAIDNDRTNNAIANLRYGTRSENHDDQWRHGTMPHGSNHARSKLTESDVIEIRRRTRDGETGAALAREFGVNKTTICSILKGRVWNWLEEDRSHD